MRKFDPMAFAVAYAVLAPLALSMLANWQHMPKFIQGLGHPSVAAWAQAIGAIAAVYAAWLVGNRQAEAARLAAERAVEAQVARDQEARYAVRLAAFTVMKLATDRIAMIAKALDGDEPEPSWFDSMALMVAGTERMVTGFPIHQITDPTSMDYFARTVSVIELCSIVVNRTAKELATSPSSLGETRSELLEDFKRWEFSLREFMKMYKLKLVFHYDPPSIPMP